MNSPRWVRYLRLRFSIRGALAALTFVAVCLAVLREHARAQSDAARALLALKCDLRYEPVCPFADRLAFFANRSNTISFHCFHNLCGVVIGPLTDVDAVVTRLKSIPSVKRIELRVGGTCGTSWASGKLEAERIEHELPGVSAEVTSLLPVTEQEIREALAQVLKPQVTNVPP